MNKNLAQTRKLEQLYRKERKLKSECLSLKAKRRHLRGEYERALDDLAKALGAYSQTHENSWAYGELKEFDQNEKNRERVRSYLENSVKQHHALVQDRAAHYDKFQNTYGSKIEKLDKRIETTQVAIRLLGGTPHKENSYI